MSSFNSKGDTEKYVEAKPNIITIIIIIIITVRHKFDFYSQPDKSFFCSFQWGSQNLSCLNCKRDIGQNVGTKPNWIKCWKEAYLDKVLERSLIMS